MRLTLRTNLAMRTLMVCAVNPDRVVRKSDIAQSCNASENHLGLVIHQLAQKGFIVTLRGRTGGIRLARAPEQISVGKVVRDLEACLPFTECFDEAQNNCPLTQDCVLRGLFGGALEAFYAELDPVSLADLVRDNTGLRDVLALSAA
ncbi:MAG: Rrf2 family transcriptional regulator [Pseudomonadota bacterium]